MIHEILSPQNPKIKQLLKLQTKHSERKESGLIVVEGRKEFELALLAGYKVNSLYFCKQYISIEELSLISGDYIDFDVFSLSVDAFAKIAYRESTSGIVALFHAKSIQLEDLKINHSAPLIIVLEAIEKPGNLGAILRSADAANVDAVIVCDPLVDLFNPNVIRASIGTVFTNTVIACTSDEAMQWLAKQDITVYAAELKASIPYHTCNFEKPTAFVMGTEAYGLTPQWLNFCHHRIIIPMSGKIDSLNVSTSTAILVFEAMRQRNFTRRVHEA
jgi:TrmH family RNA methyltransferase